MSHFARVIDGIVQEVIVAEQDFINTLPNPETWIQTSYNTRGGVHYNPETGEPSEDQTKALRKNYAGIGDTYDVQRDAFIAPQPFPSWSLNEVSCFWEPPVPYPSDDGVYIWDESTLAWVTNANI